LTMAGENFLVDGGSFTMADTRTITFSRQGSTTLGGATINNIQLGSVTITSGSLLSAPNNNINVSGTWLNGGTFAPNGSTVTFNRAGDQNIDPNGQPFNNVAFAGSGIKELLGPLDV